MNSRLSSQKTPGRRPTQAWWIGVFLFVIVCAAVLLNGCALVRTKVELTDTPDAPVWLQARANAANTAFIPGPEQVPDMLLWETKTGGEVRNELTADRGIIVAPSRDGRLYFLNALTGAREHRQDFKGPPTSSIFIGDSLVFAVDGNKPQYYLWDIRRQTRLAGGRIPRTFVPPLRLEDDWLFLTHRGKVLRVDDSDSTIWSHSFEEPLLSKPAVVDGRLFIVTGGKRVACLNADNGEVIWQHFSAGGHAASPAVDEMVYFGSLDSNFYALAVGTGEMLWFFHTEGQIFTSPAVDDRFVYFGSNDSFFYALDKSSGHLVWRIEAGLVHDSSPVVWGSTVIFGTSDGRLLVLDKNDGRVLSQFTTRGSIYSPPIVYDNRVYITDAQRRVYCFQKTK